MIDTVSEVKCVQLYKTLYHLLFNAVTDALRALDAGEPDRARELLIFAQQSAEARYLQTGDEQKSALR